MKSTYIKLMENVLDAYSDEDILNYLNKVKTDGMTEHGFPRLTANIGILIANGKKAYLYDTFIEMMDICCSEFLKLKKPGMGNDFSVKEIIFCIMELEKSKVVQKEKIDEWKALLSKIKPEDCYNKFASSTLDRPTNWALFTAVSEFMRNYIGVADTKDFVELQIATQLKRFDENYMYRDDSFNHTNPMVYDIVPRGLFSVLLHFGYDGKYKDTIDKALKSTGLLTLDMQSVTGELPFGGRSNQCLYNEALVAIIMEYEANRYYKSGDLELAGKFKTGAKKALDVISKWLLSDTITHVKNYYPPKDGIGCERYAYFDKYMITTASYLYVGYMFCNDDIVATESIESPKAFCLSKNFNKTFLKNENWFVQIDDDADEHYDTTGIGRVHFKNAPSAICLSLSGTSTPNYKSGIEQDIDFSIAPAVMTNEGLLFGFKNNSKYILKELKTTEDSAISVYECAFSNWDKVTFVTEVKNDFVEIKAISDSTVALMLPAFNFDGKTYTKIVNDKNVLEIYYQGYVCRYTSNDEIFSMDEIGFNRNGEYKIYCTKGEGEVCVKIEIEPAL